MLMPIKILLGHSTFSLMLPPSSRSLILNPDHPSSVTVSLPQGRVQEIKHMTLVNFTHGLILTCTQKSRYIYKSFIAIFTKCTTSLPNPTPHVGNKTTPLYLLGEPASLLVVTNTHPPLFLVCQQLPHPFAFAPLTLSHPTVQNTLFT
jgi:hypothetical protein